MVVTELALSPARLGGLQIRHLLTLAITWPQGVHVNVENYMAAAQVDGGVRKLPQHLEP